MSHISADNELVTLINVFNVEPQNQDKLIKLLEKATEEVMRHQLGFISANMQHSLDGVNLIFVYHPIIISDRARNVKQKNKN